MMPKDIALIEDVIAKAFPAGARLILNPDEAPPKDRYYLISGRTDPRWIIPQNHKHGRSAIDQWTPPGLSSRIKWYCLKKCYRAGILWMVPRITSIAIVLPDKNGWKNLGWNQPDPPFATIFIRWLTPVRKVIATLVDAKTLTPKMSIKMPLTPIATKLILHEARTLSMLASQNLRLAPRLLFLDEKNCVATQEYIDGLINKRKFTHAHLEFLKKLRIEGEKIPLAKLSGELEERLKSLTDVGKEKIDMLKRLIESVGGTASVPAVIVHGDFHCANLILTENSRLMACDWEFSLEQGPPLWDIFHFYVFKGRDPYRCYSLEDKVKSNPLCIEYMKEFGIDDTIYLKLYYYYIISEAITVLGSDLAERNIPYPNRKIILGELDCSFKKIE